MDRPPRIHHLPRRGSDRSVDSNPLRDCCMRLYTAASTPEHTAGRRDWNCSRKSDHNEHLAWNIYRCRRDFRSRPSRTARPCTRSPSQAHRRRGFGCCRIEETRSSRLLRHRRTAPLVPYTPRRPLRSSSRRCSRYRSALSSSRYTADYCSFVRRVRSRRPLGCESGSSKIASICFDTLEGVCRNPRPCCIPAGYNRLMRRPRTTNSSPCPPPD